MDAKTAKMENPLVMIKASWPIYKQKFWQLIALTLATPIGILVLVGIGAGVGVLIPFFNLPLAVFMIIFGILICVYIFLSVELVIWSLAAQAAIRLIIKNNSQKYSFKEALLAGRKQIKDFFIVSFTVGLFTLLWSLLLIIPGIIMGIYYSLAIWVYFYEGIKGNAALKRSRELVKDYWWAVFGRLILVGLVVGFVINLPTAFMDKDSIATANYSFISTILEFLIAPLIIVYTRQIYLSLVKIKSSAVQTPLPTAPVNAPQVNSQS